MAARDPDAQRLRPDVEMQRRVEIQRLAVYAGMYRCLSKHVEVLSAPGPPRGVWSVIRRIDNDDSQSASVQRWARAQWRPTQ